MKLKIHFWRCVAVIILGAALIVAAPAGSEERAMSEEIAAAALEIEAQLIEARRWFHQHPELSNREVETGREIARRLREMGYDVETGVAHNGVVAADPWWRGGPTSTPCPSTSRWTFPTDRQTPG